MKKTIFLATITAAVLMAANAFAYSDMKQDCTKCHNLTKEDAGMLMSVLAPGITVIDITQGPIKGFWQVDIERSGKKNVVYIDYSKKMFIGGPIISFRDRKNYTQDHLTDITRVDVSTIPLDDAVVLGNPKAKNKVIVFSDPDCPYCSRLHDNMKEVVAQRDDVAFYIKMFPLPMHKGADMKAKAIICQKSLKLLEDAYQKKEVPAPACDTKAVDKNIELAGKLGINGTPAIIFSDGRLVSGAMDTQGIIANLTK